MASSSSSSRSAPAAGVGWAVVLLVAALAPYAGTVRGDFAFDDHVAVKNNRDVLGGNSTLSELFTHDFWGNEVANPGSHKSYRPLTVLLWRGTHALWTHQLLPPLRRLAAAVPAGAPSRVLSGLTGALAQEGPQPFPFHVLNVALHALASLLVLHLARRLFTVLHAMTIGAGGGGPAPRGPELQAQLAALLFAVHPIHTEAVAGMVGLAELLSVVLGVPALLLYIGAVQQGIGGGTTSALRHWAAVCGAGCLVLAAALTKEIGITLAGTMVLFDLLLGPAMLPRPASTTAGHCNAGSATDAAVTHDGCKSGEAPAPSTKAAAARRQLLRMAFMLGVAIGYLKLRSCIMGRSTPANIRRLENSLPYAPTFASRVLSTGFVHARYAALLVLPHPLVAEWGFDCIPLVTSWWDPRNALTLLLYSALLHSVLAARPLQLLARLWQVVQCACGRDEQPCTTAAPAASSLAAARWRLLVVAGLMVAPFFPASNVLFFVGTTIGERLLYTPSIGFCCLAVALLLPGPRLEAWAAELSAVFVSPNKAAGRDSSGKRSRSSRGSVAAAALTALVLTAATARTVHRCQDWLTDDRLFAAAARDCPNSVKMREIHGVMELHKHQRPAAALAHFQHVARVAEAGGLAGYCPVTHLMGLAEWELGHSEVALELLKEAMSCPDGDTAVKAMQALNRCFAAQRSKQPANLMPLLDWATVLARADVMRVPEACAAAEAAAMAAVQVGQADLADRSVDVCLRAAQHLQESAPQAYADQHAAQLISCVSLRRQVYSELSSAVMSLPGAAAAAFNTTAFTTAVYKYLGEVDAHHPVCRTLAGGGHTGDVSTHHKLLTWANAERSNDPWLQLEWGRTLLAANSSAAALPEAGLHLHAAALLFAKAARELQAGHARAVAPTAHWAHPVLTPPAVPGTLALDGVSSLSPLDAVEAAMLPLDAFIEAARAGEAAAAAVGETPADNSTALAAATAAGSAVAETREAFCQMHELKCELQGQRAELMAQAADDEDDGDEATAAAARDQHRLCLAQLAGQAWCHGDLGGTMAAAVGVGVGVSTPSTRPGASRQCSAHAH